MENKQDSGWKKLRKKLYDMVSMGVTNSRLNQAYDIISTLALILNLVAAFAITFDEIEAQYGPLLRTIDSVTVLFFAIDYVLRIITAPCEYPELSEGEAVKKYMTSGFGIIDLLSFLPNYLPAFFPAGAAVFRMFRVVRIFRLFRINAYSDSLSLIAKVVSSKKTQILASIFIIVMLILASSLCMYSVEHEAQPEVFKNAFSGIWWATSTLLTVGYGDIYPVTVLGQILGIVISFLGVGLVAIPTGILSAGFIEEYQNAKRTEIVEEKDAIHFIEVTMRDGDSWVGKKIRELGLPKGTIIAVIGRGERTIVPYGDITIMSGDKLIICAESADNDTLENIKELELKAHHPWNGLRIKDLEFSRKAFIVLINRDGEMLIPHGDTRLEEGDKLLIYTKENIKKYQHEALF